MKITLIITTLFLISCSSDTDCCAEQDTCINENLIDLNKACTKEYRPVCGCNNITYSNPCVSEGAGVMSWEEGECN